MKILVVHASAGAGHMKAAEAVANVLRNNPAHDVHFLDALDRAPSIYKSLYRGTYSFLISRIPDLWGVVFGLLDVPTLQPAVRTFRRIYNTIHCGGFERFLMNEQFDWVISTHFMPTEITSALKRRGKIRSKLLTVVTDFDVHKIWLASHVDFYAVASDWTQEKIRSLGVPADKVVVTGIPTDEKFAAVYEISDLKKKYDLIDDVFTVLVATGSFGIGPIEEIIDSLKGFQIIVVCGHNKSLYERLTLKKAPLVHVKGLVNNMYEWMAVSDAMVSKPGGLSIAEALVMQLPLVFFNAIPGQETNNIRVLKHYGIGVNTNNIEDIVAQMEQWKSSKDAHLTALKKTKTLARPNAAKDIVRLVERS
jgi:processive 1,2-diacylglycerol beta-glucosyltransferase